MPEPTDSQVHLKSSEEGDRWATYGYGGWATAKRNDEAYASLKQWLSDSATEYDETQVPMFAEFDSPFVPGFFRHNDGNGGLDFAAKPSSFLTSNGKGPS